MLLRVLKKRHTFALAKRKEQLKRELKTLARALSSAGSERLPYKQRVGGSNPSAPTEMMDGSLAQLNRAFDYGSKGCRFESCRSHCLTSQWIRVVTRVAKWGRL